MFSERTFTRLDLLRFPLIVGVVFIHAYESWVEMAGQIVGVIGSSSTADFVRNAISQGVARLSVPMLFLISGYLFFREGEFTRSGYFRKLRARLHTLVYPMVFWNIFTLVVIGCLQSVPATASFFSGRNLLIADYSANDIIAAVFGIGRAPIAHQFWFVRDLVILLLLTPAIAGLLRVSSSLFLISLFTCWFLDLWPVVAPSAEATFFVAFGCFLALTRRDLFSLDRYGPAAITIYIVLLTVYVLMYEAVGGGYLHKVSVPFGIIALLYYSGQVIDRIPRLAAALIALSGASFFVFAAHDPLLTAVRKLAYRFVRPDSDSTILLLYFTIPIGVLVSLVVLNRMLRWLAPRATSLISGLR